MISLRPIEECDFSLVADLANRAFHTTWRDAAWVAGHCARHRTSPEDSRIALLDHQPVGYVLMAYPAEPGAQVAHLGVVPEARRQGVARALLDHAAAAAEQRTYPWLWVGMDGENAAAVSCYRAAGFEIASREPTWQTMMPDELPPSFLDSVVFRPIEDPLGMYDWYDALPLSFDHWTFEQYRHFPGQPQAVRATRHGETIGVAYTVKAPDGRCLLAKLRLAEMADWIPEFLRAAASPGQPFAVTDPSDRYGQWFASWGYTPGKVALWMRRCLAS